MMQNHLYTNRETISVKYPHAKYVDQSIQLNRWILKTIGVWPNSPNISWKEKYLYRLLNSLCYCLIAFLLVPCALYIVFEVKDIYTKIQLIGPLIFCVAATIKYSSLIIRGDDIRKCIKYIETDWKTVKHVCDRDIMLVNANFGRRLVTICCLFLYSGVVFYYIAVPVSVGKILAENTNLTFIPLVYPVSRLLADTRYSPINEIFLFVQCLSGFLVHSITAGACSLAAAFAMHACGQLQVLMLGLDHLIDGRDDLYKDVDNRIGDLVRQHVRVLSFITLTEKVLQQISLTEIVSCTLDICLLGYYIIKEWESEDSTLVLTYSVLLVSLTFNIFIFCYIGELVTEQCKKVGDVSYMIDWHRLRNKRGLGLILIISMSNSSIRLTAGNLFELSMSSFGNVLKTSVAYLNMLRTLTS